MARDVDFEKEILRRLGVPDAHQGDFLEVGAACAENKDLDKALGDLATNDQAWRTLRTYVHLLGLGGGSKEINGATVDTEQNEKKRTMGQGVLRK